MRRISENTRDFEIKLRSEKVTATRSPEKRTDSAFELLLASLEIEVQGPSPRDLDPIRPLRHQQTQEPAEERVIDATSIRRLSCKIQLRKEIERGGGGILIRGETHTKRMFLAGTGLR